jgi:signal transduction histidine kinase
MARSPTSLKTALLVGFLVIFGAWLLSTSYFTAHLLESQAQSVQVHARYAREQELLFSVRSKVLLGSIYLRDALETGGGQASLSAVRDQLNGLRAEMDGELSEYRAIDPSVGNATWMRLEQELHDYWQAAMIVVGLDPADAPVGARARLRTEVVPRRDVIVEMSDEIRQIVADAFVREQDELARTNRLVYRRIWETTAAAVIVGVAIAVMSTWYVSRLEGALRQDHAEVVRGRQELRQLSGRLVRAQEEERRVIARELHDEIGQALTAVDVELALAGNAVGGDGPAARAVGEARTVTRRALAEVRDLSQLLRPSVLDDFGLPEALKWYMRRFSDRTGVRAELIEDGSVERLPTDVEVCVYRVVQEALTNVSRHARATACRVLVQRLPSSIVVTVEDDGIGLPETQQDAGLRPEGVGLVGVRERIAELNGTFRIEGQPGHGTRLTIELPCAGLDEA